jgi:hypothetical protein
MPKKPIEVQKIARNAFVKYVCSAWVRFSIFVFLLLWLPLTSSSSSSSSSSAHEVRPVNDLFHPHGCLRLRSEYVFKMDGLLVPRATTKFFRGYLSSRRIYLHHCFRASSALYFLLRVPSLRQLVLVVRLQTFALTLLLSCGICIAQESRLGREG